MGRLNLNNVMFAGTLTRDPEMRMLGSDRAVTNFGMASNRKYKNGSGELIEEATFVDFEAWGREAEIIAQYTKKGSPLCIEGRLKFDQFEDKEGNKRSKLKVVVNRVHLMGEREDSGGQSYQAKQPTHGNQGGAVVPPPADLDDQMPPF